MGWVSNPWGRAGALLCRQRSLIIYSFHKYLLSPCAVGTVLGSGRQKESYRKQRKSLSSWSLHASRKGRQK